MVTPQRVGHGARTPKRRMNGQGLTRIANPGFGARLVASIRLDSRRSWPRTWRFFPAYRPPPDWAEPLVKVFRDHRKDIDSEVTQPTRMKSNDVLAVIGDDVDELGFQVELGKQKLGKQESAPAGKFPQTHDEKLAHLRQLRAYRPLHRRPRYRSTTRPAR